MKTAYNWNKIVKIQLVEERESIWYSWRNQRKLWPFGIIQKEGIYQHITDVYCGTEINNHEVVNGKVLEFTHVIINYQSGIEQKRYFDTTKEAERFYEILLSYIDKDYTPNKI